MRQVWPPAILSTHRYAIGGLPEPGEPEEVVANDLDHPGGFARDETAYFHTATNVEVSMWSVLGGSEEDAALAEAFAKAMHLLVGHPACAPMTHRQVLDVGVLVTEYVTAKYLTRPATERAWAKVREEWRLERRAADGHLLDLAIDVGEAVIREGFVEFRSDAIQSVEGATGSH